MTQVLHGGIRFSYAVSIVACRMNILRHSQAYVAMLQLHCSIL